jgi:hypothetical protein
MNNHKILSVNAKQQLCKTRVKLKQALYSEIQDGDSRYLENRKSLSTFKVIVQFCLHESF